MITGSADQPQAAAPDRGERAQSIVGGQNVLAGLKAQHAEVVYCSFWDLRNCQTQTMV